MLETFQDAYNAVVNDEPTSDEVASDNWLMQEEISLASKNVAEAEAANFSMARIGAGVGSVLAFAAIGVYLVRKQKTISSIEEAFLRA